MKLVGITRIVSKKTGNTFMKLSCIDESDNPNRVGADVMTEMVPYDDDYIALVGHDINIIYRKAFDGRAVVDHVEKGES